MSHYHYSFWPLTILAPLLSLLTHLPLLTFVVTELERTWENYPKLSRTMQKLGGFQTRNLRGNMWRLHLQRFSMKSRSQNFLGCTGKTFLHYNIYKQEYPLVICYIAIENDPVEIVDFPINSMVIFQFAMLNYQRVIGYKPTTMGIYNYAGWWFGSFFSIQLGMSSSQLTNSSFS